MRHLGFLIFWSCILGLGGAARGHMTANGWNYPRECCHDRDCAPISEDRLIYDTKTDAYKVRGIPGETFVNPDRRIPEADGHHGWSIRSWLWSNDDRFHRCASALPEQSAKHTFCLIV